MKGDRLLKSQKKRPFTQLFFISADEVNLNSFTSGKTELENID